MPARRGYLSGVGDNFSHTTAVRLFPSGPMESTLSARIAPPPRIVTAFTASRISSATAAFFGEIQYPPTRASGTQNSAKTLNSATARAVTTSKLSLHFSSRPKSSARPQTTSTFVNPISRVVASRKFVRFRSVSNSVNRHPGRAIASGIPGSPAPLPTSSTRVASAPARLARVVEDFQQRQRVARVRLEHLLRARRAREHPVLALVLANQRARVGEHLFALFRVERRGERVVGRRRASRRRQRSRAGEIDAPSRERTTRERDGRAGATRAMRAATRIARAVRAGVIARARVRSRRVNTCDVDVDARASAEARARGARCASATRDVDADGVDAPPGTVYAPRRRARTAETSKSTRMEILKDFKASTLTRRLRVVEGDGADDARAWDDKSSYFSSARERGKENDRAARGGRWMLRK